MKINNPIYQGRMGAKLVDEEGLSPENPRVFSRPLSPIHSTAKSLKPMAKSRRKMARSAPLPRKSLYLRLPRVCRRPLGAKLVDEEEEPTPESPRVPTPPPSPKPKTLEASASASPAVLPAPVGSAPDISNPQLYRRLPRSWFRYRVLPSWMTAGVAAAGRSEAVPSDGSD